MPESTKTKAVSYTTRWDTIVGRIGILFQVIIG
jgi:hypothetical protein